MAVTIQLYEHTALRFANGANAPGDTYRISLYSAAVFTGSHTTKAEIDAVSTALPTGHGYTRDAMSIPLTLSQLAGGAAMADSPDTVWTAVGGSIGPAAHALIYNDTDSGDPPVALVSFGGDFTATDGTTFSLAWDVGGIIGWS